MVSSTPPAPPGPRRADPSTVSGTGRSLSWLGTGCLACSGPDGPLCASCARQLESPPAGPVRGVGPVPALFAYRGRGRDVVGCLKYRDGRRLLAELADPLAELVPPVVDAVSWVPTSRARRRDRGFDQAELLARAVARRCGLPVVDVLVRVPGPHQTGRSAVQRQHGVRFRARRARAGPADVVLVDDVVTTGATLRAAASVLRAVAVRPRFVALARTP